MPRPVILSSGPWADLSCEEFAQKAGEWGYQGLELDCLGDHFEVQASGDDADYCQRKLDLLQRFDLTLPVLSNSRVGHAVCGQIAEHYQSFLPDYIWGDGDPAGVRERAAEEMIGTLRAGQKLGVSVVSGCTGSPLWPLTPGFPQTDGDDVARALQHFTDAWTPILDVAKDAGVRFAARVEPGQLASDLHTAEMALETLDGREDFGFAFNPAALHWQGVDPLEFLRRFPDRIYHVHLNDVAINLNGRTSLLSAYLPAGDARRGWDHRSPGHGGLDWEKIIRGLNEINYAGPISIDWKDPGMDRDFGAEDACRFVKRLDFAPVSQPVVSRSRRRK